MQEIRVWIRRRERTFIPNHIGEFWEVRRANKSIDKLEGQWIGFDSDAVDN